MDLFDYMRQTNQEKEAPLAARLRPRTLDEVVGQQHIIGKDKLLYRAIQADKLSSIIFYGPPGTGKTTLLRHGSPWVVPAPRGPVAFVFGDAAVNNCLPAVGSSWVVPGLRGPGQCVL